MLVGSDAFLADRIDVVDGGAQPDRFHDRRRPGLEFVRGVAIGDPVPRDLADHLAAAIIGAHGNEVLMLGIEHADTCRPI